MSQTTRCSLTHQSEIFRGCDHQVEGFLRNFGEFFISALLGMVIWLAPEALQAAEAASDAAGHGDPFAVVFEVFVILLICAMIGRYGARKLKQSPVLGELVIGIIVGATIYQLAAPTITIIRHSDLIGQASTKALNEKITMPEAVRADLKKANLPEDQDQKIEQVVLRPDFPNKLLLARAIELFSSLGVILLLFMVGLECSLEEMAAVGVLLTTLMTPPLLKWAIERLERRE